MGEGDVGFGGGCVPDVFGVDDLPDDSAGVESSGDVEAGGVRACPFAGEVVLGVAGFFRFVLTSAFAALGGLVCATSGRRSGRIKA